MPNSCDFSHSMPSPFLHSTALVARRFLSVFLFGALALLVAGCSSPQNRRGDPGTRIPPQPTLTGEAAWFDGTVTSHVTVSAFGRPPRQPDAANGEERRDGRPPFGGGRGGPPPGMEPGDGSRPARMGQVALPRQTLQVELVNNSPEEVTVSVRECLSLLGNFAVRPERVTLAPGQSVKLEAMRGAYGANLDRLDVTLELSRKGETERRTVVAEKAPQAPE